MVEPVQAEAREQGGLAPAPVVVDPDETTPEGEAWAVMPEGESPLPQGFSDQLAELEALRGERGLEAAIRRDRILEQIRARDLGAFIDALGYRHDSTVSDLFARWVKYDRQGALDYVIAEKPNHWSVSSQLFRDWAKEDFDGAMRAINGMPRHRRDGAISNLISALGREDPRRALELAKREFSNGNNSWHYNNVFRSWTNDDPESARAAIEQVPEGQSRRRAWEGYFSALAQKDPQGAFDEAMQLTDGALQRDALRSVYSNWLYRDPDAALAAVAELPSLSLRGEVLERSTYNLPTSDPWKFIDQFNILTDGSKQDSLIQNYLRRVADSDPRLAAQVISEMPFGAAYKNSARQLADQWSSYDPVSALDWVSTLPPGDERNSSMDAAMSNFAKAYPQEAMRYLQTMDPDEANRLASTLTRGLAQYDAELGVRLIAEIGREDLRQKLNNELMEAWGNEDPLAVLDHLRQTGQEVDSQFSWNIANSLSNKDPAAAGAWVVGLKDEKARERAIQTVANNWLNHDSYEASIWITGLPEGKDRDQGLETLVNHTRRYDPATAFDWSMDIGDEKQRYNSARGAMQEWIKDDRDSAETALRRSDLPTENINKLLEELFKQP